MKRTSLKHFLLILFILVTMICTGCSGSSTDILLKVTKTDGSEVGADDIEQLKNALMERLKLLYVNTDKVSFTYNGDGSLLTTIGETDLTVSDINLLISDGRIALRDSAGKVILENEGIEEIGVSFDPDNT